jgi:hypothetical protein
MLSTNSISFGATAGPISFLANPRMSILISSVASLPFLKHKRFYQLPNRRLRLSITAASATAGCLIKVLSTSRVPPCPEVLIISSARPINQNSRRHLPDHR